MKYTLVKSDGTLGQSKDFGAEQVPIIAPNKGRWLPDTEPAYDAATHTVQPALPVPANAVAVPYNITPRPAEVIAAEQLEATRYAATVAARNAIKIDAFVQSFIAMTPAEVDAYVQANVNNLADAKSLLKKLSVMVLLLARREFQD